MARSIFLSKKQTFGVFLYSLLFLGVSAPYISFLCLLAVIPFTGGAWIGGMAAVSMFNTNSAYLPAAWFAVFVQAYLTTLAIAAFRKPNETKTPEGTAS